MQFMYTATTLAITGLVFIFKSCVTLGNLFQVPYHYGGHTRPRVHLVGSLNPSWRKTGNGAVLKSRGRYDCHHKFRTVKCLCKVSRLRDCDLPLQEAVVFVCVHVLMCQQLLYQVLISCTYVW